jgi:hypothetical protein
LGSPSNLPLRGATVPARRAFCRSAYKAYVQDLSTEVDPAVLAVLEEKFQKAGTICVDRYSESSFGRFESHGGLCFTSFDQCVETCNSKACGTARFTVPTSWPL